MSSSNIKVLTQSHAVAAKKRKAKRDEIQKITFDDEARRCVIQSHSSLLRGRGSTWNAPVHEIRREFLTGFRKRKQQRTEEKKAKRVEREKQERLEMRRQVSSFVFEIAAWGGELTSAGQNRRMLAERAAENAAQVEAAYGGNPADEGGAQGSDSEEDVIQEEYENEEQVATVTVVEEFDIDALIHTESPLERIDPGSSSNQDQDQARRVELPAKKSKITATNKKSGASAKKFKYGTNAARLAEKKKQQARKFEKAARAGGKQSRSSKRK